MNGLCIRVLKRDVLRKVFSFLNPLQPLAAVCKYWRYVAVEALYASMGQLSPKQLQQLSTEPPYCSVQSTPSSSTFVVALAGASTTPAIRNEKMFNKKLGNAKRLLQARANNNNRNISSTNNSNNFDKDKSLVGDQAVLSVVGAAAGKVLSRPSSLGLSALPLPASLSDAPHHSSSDRTVAIPDRKNRASVMVQLAFSQGATGGAEGVRSALVSDGFDTADAIERTGTANSYALVGADADADVNADVNANLESDADGDALVVFVAPSDQNRGAYDEQDDKESEICRHGVDMNDMNSSGQAEQDHQQAAQASGDGRGVQSVAVETAETEHFSAGGGQSGSKRGSRSNMTIARRVRSQWSRYSTQSDHQHRAIP